MCSTAASLSACATLPEDFPKIPRPLLKQTLYRQNICNPDRTSCQVVDKCQFWRITDDGEWVKAGEGPIKSSDPKKSCHGSFGISAEEMNATQKWLRAVENWCRKRNCDGPTAH